MENSKLIKPYYDQSDIEVMDAEEYSYFLAYGMTEEQHQLESLIANTCTDS